MKTLLFVISALAIFAGWCQGRDYSRNFVQYKANPDNLTEYWQCLKSKSGYSAVKQSCQKCFIFSDDIWKCVKITNDDCPTEAPITEVISYMSDWCSVTGNGPAGEYVQYFKQGNVCCKYLWYIGLGPDSAVEMSCAPGTFFSFEPCRCVLCDDQGACADASKRVFTLNFDNKANENGVYFDFSDSVTYVSDPEGSGKSAQFDGASDAEVPYFQNNEFRQFTMALKLKKYANGASEQGLVYNGGNPAVADYAPPSLDISIADSTKLVARILTDDGAFSVQSSVEVAADEWVSAVCRYDGAVFGIWVNEVNDFI